MKIAADSSVNFSTTHQYSQVEYQSEQSEFWIDEPEAKAMPQGDSVSISNEANELCQQDPIKDLKLTLLRLFVEYFSGKTCENLDDATVDFDFIDPDNVGASASGGLPEAPVPEAPVPEAPPKQGWGFKYDAQYHYEESETMQFSASGVVKTADGKTINFTAEITMQRKFSIDQQISIRAGDALMDPLVLNFAGEASLLNPERSSFDLNSDGTADNIAIPTANSGAYLAYDKNHNGKIDDGSELFGPTTGDAFAELANYDVDKNNWIDENDPIFKELLLMSKDADDKVSISPLHKRGIGALHTGRTHTPFAFTDDANNTYGKLKESGVFLYEDGQAGHLGAVDLAV